MFLLKLPIFVLCVWSVPYVMAIIDGSLTYHDKNIDSFPFLNEYLALDDDADLLAMGKIRKCSYSKECEALQLSPECSKDYYDPTLTLYYLIERIWDFQRRVGKRHFLLSLGQPECVEIAKHNTTLYKRASEITTIYWGVRVAVGPNGQDNETMKDMPCLSLFNNTILTFDEEVGPTKEYTLPMVKEMKEFSERSNNKRILMEAQFSVNSDIGIFTQTLSKSEVNLYQLKGQPLPPLPELQRLWFHVLNTGNETKLLLLDRRTTDNVLGYNSHVQWHINAPRKPVDSHMLNSAASYSFLLDQNHHHFWNVSTHQNRHYVTMKGQMEQQVRLETVLQMADEDSVMVFHFPNEDYHLTDIDKWIVGTKVFILVRCVLGPNAGAGQLQSLDHINENLKDVIYVLGWVENQEGPDRMYSQHHIEGMIRALNHPKLKDKEVGILFAPDFLGTKMGVNELYYLMQKPQWKYAFLKQFKDSSNGDLSMTRVKYNFKCFERHSYIYATFAFRNSMYLYEVIEGPPCATPPSIQGQSSPPSRVQNTFAAVPVTLTAPGMPPTTQFKLSFTEGMFPSVKSTAPAWPLRKWIAVMSQLVLALGWGMWKL